jgi:hypothetical protein
MLNVSDSLKKTRHKMWLDAPNRPTDGELTWNNIPIKWPSV